MEFKFPSRPMFSKNLGIRSFVGRVLFKWLHLWANVEWTKTHKTIGPLFQEYWNAGNTNSKIK